MTPATLLMPLHTGGAYQQATSGLSITDQNCYTQNTGCHSVYGYEYAPGECVACDFVLASPG